MLGVRLVLVLDAKVVDNEGEHNVPCAMKFGNGESVGSFLLVM